MNDYESPLRREARRAFVAVLAGDDENTACTAFALRAAVLTLHGCVMQGAGLTKRERKLLRFVAKWTMMRAQILDVVYLSRLSPRERFEEGRRRRERDRIALSPRPLPRREHSRADREEGTRRYPRGG